MMVRGTDMCDMIYVLRGKAMKGRNDEGNYEGRGKRDGHYMTIVLCERRYLDDIDYGNYDMKADLIVIMKNSI